MTYRYGNRQHLVRSFCLRRRSGALALEQYRVAQFHIPGLTFVTPTDLRKIAREAVIFALLGAVLASLWFFVEESRNRQRREAERELSDARAAAASEDPAYRILFVAQDVDTDTRTEAWRVFWESENLAEFTRRLRPLNLPQAINAELWEAKAPCSQRTSDIFPPDSPGEKMTVLMPDGREIANVPVGTTKGEVMKRYNAFLKERSTEDQNPFARLDHPAGKNKPQYSDLPPGAIVIPVYCRKMTPEPTGWHLVLPDSLRWPEPRASWLKIATGSVSPALFLGFILGFPSGLGAWVFYRLVRFAIKG